MVDNVITKRWLWLIFVYPEIAKTKINNKINIQWNTIFMTTYAVCQKSYHCMRLSWMIPFDMYSTNTFIFIEMYKINYLRYICRTYIFWRWYLFTLFNPVLHLNGVWCIFHSLYKGFLWWIHLIHFLLLFAIDWLQLFWRLMITSKVLNLLQRPNLLLFLERII